MDSSTIQQLIELKRFAFSHWKAIAAVYGAACAISGMPTPNGSGFLGSWYYKWAYSTLHTAAANPGRVLAFLAPYISPFLPAPLQALLKPFLSNPQSSQPDSSQQASGQAAGK